MRNTDCMEINRPTKEEIVASVDKTVPDVIAPNLKVLFCGINPGLYTAAIGHHFGRPGNRFWKAMFEAGFTDHLFDPSEEQKLLEKGYGITNIVSRSTLAAADLSNSELITGGENLKEKVLVYKPKFLAVLGIQAYRTVFHQSRATLGKQDETIGDTKIWVLPNPSGLNAHYTPKQLARLFEQLRVSIH